MKPFLQGRPVQQSSSLHPLTTGGAEAIANAKAAGGTCGATVETVKEGGKVVRLIVTCSCGEKIEIDCLYSGGA